MTMKTSSIMALPPKMALQFAERAKAMDGCVSIGSGMYEWAQGNTVVCLISVDPPIGHSGKDAHRAEQIRQLLAKPEPSNV